MIPYGRQDISAADIEAVVKVLQSDFLTQGPAVPAFEAAVEARIEGVKAIAVNSATSALHIGCLALGLGKGDLLWTVPNTFVASANCALYCGADVDFVDIDADTLNLSVNSLADKLVVAKREDRLPKVVVPVHFSGRATYQEAIHALGREYGFAIMEDASHAIGATREGEPVGSCRWSDLTVFSFHPVKIVTTAEGGMLTTRDAELATTLQMLRSHGITRDPARMTRNDGPWYYEQHLLGLNYRITDLQAALGVSQIGRLDAFIARRNELARRYDDRLADLPLKRPIIPENEVPAWHLYVVQLESAEQRRKTYDRLREAEIFPQVHYIPVHLQPYYRNLDARFAPGYCPVAESYYERALTLPLFASMSNAEQDRVVETLTAALR